MKTVRQKLESLLPIFVLVCGAAALGVLGGCGGGNSSNNSDNPSPPPPPPPPPSYAVVSGTVMGGLHPIAKAAVTAYAVGTGAGAAPIEIGTATSDSSGGFKITATSKPDNGRLVYLTVSGGDTGSGSNPAIGLMAVAGAWCDAGSDADCDYPASVKVNELSTAAAAAVFQRYIKFEDCSNITGNDQSGTCIAIMGASGLAATALTLGNLLDVAGAGPSGFLTAPADASSIHLTLERMNTIASLLAACVQADVSSAPNACANLFGEIGNGAADTLDAAWQIANNATVNADGAGLFALMPGTPVFAPVLGTAPANWTIGGQRYAYVSNASGSVSAYRIDSTTGAPVPVTTGGAASCYGPGGPPFDPMNCFPAAIAPAAIAVSPNGRFVFVADCEGPPNNISAYAVDPGTGALVEIAGSPFLGGPHPFSVKVDASGRYLVVAQIGPSDGAGPAPRQGFVGVYTIDPVSGVLAEVKGSPFKAGDSTHTVALDPQDRFVFASNYGPDVATSSGSAAAFSLDAASGALTPIAGEGSCGEGLSADCFAAGPQLWKMTVDASGRFIYGVNFGGNSISAWSIDGKSGMLTPIDGTVACGPNLQPVCFAAGDFPIGIMADPAGTYVFVVNTGNGDGHDQGTGTGSIGTYSIDPATGALKLVSSIANTQSPHWGAVDTAGQYLYVANMDNLNKMIGNNVSVYAIDPATGALTEIKGSPFFAGPGSDAVAVTP